MVVVLVVLVVVVVGAAVVVVVVGVAVVVVVVVAAVVTLKGTTLQPTVKVATVRVLGVAELVCLTSTTSLLLIVPAELVKAPPFILYCPPVILIGVGISIEAIITAFEVNDVQLQKSTALPTTF